MKKTKIYISYARGILESKDEIEKNRQEFADHLHTELEASNFEVVRDVRSLGYRDSINEFTDSLTNGEYIIAIVSQKYLMESRYCQEEIRELIHKQRPYYPIVTFDAENVKQASQKENYIDNARLFINKYAEKHFREEEKEKFLECKRTIGEFINKLNDELVLNQNQVKELIATIVNDRKKKVENIKEEPPFHEENHKVFEYASILSQFDLLLPVSLYKKLNQDEWGNLEFFLRSESDENSIGVGLVGSILKPEEEYLGLNEYGKAKSLTTESQDQLIYQILVHCDAEIELEYELFNSLTLKEKYIDSIFQNFSYSLESLITESNSLYPQSKKQTLLYRLLAIHYSKRGNKVMMREAFKKCIDLLKSDKENALSSFFLGWAQKEKLNNNYIKSFEIYNQVLEIFKYKRVNTVTRFNLAIHYYKIRDTKKAISYFVEKFENKFIFKTDDFWIKFSDTTFFYINRGFVEDAKALKSTLTELANAFNDKKLFNLSSYIHNKIKESIEQNVNFKKNLVSSFLKVDLEKNIIKSYIKSSDIEKAKEVLDELENSSMSAEEYQGLLIDLSYAEGNLENAIFKGEKFIKDNPTLNPYSIYIRLANIYFNYKIYGFKRFYKAIFYYEKIDHEYLKNNYMYAISLMCVRKEMKAIRIFRNFFSSSNENNKMAISNYIRCCLKIDKFNEASQFIVKKIIDRRKAQYSNSFISFLYQQQIKLTKDKTYSDSLLKEALKHIEGDTKSEAIVLNRYAEHLVSTIKFQHNRFNKPFNYNETEIEDAIKNFTASHKLHMDDRKLLSIAECYYFLNDFNSCHIFLNKITNKHQSEKKKLMLLQIHFKHKEFEEIERFVDDSSRKVKIFSLLCLGKKFNERYSKRKEFLSQAVSLDRTYYSKLQQAIVFYSINKKGRSLEIVSEILEVNRLKKNEIKEEFDNNISRFKPRLMIEKIKTIQNDLRKLSSENEILIDSINTFILDFPYNEKLLDFKFIYYLKLRNYQECENVLNTIIHKKLFYHRTSHLFYELSAVYFKKSNNYNYGNPNETDLDKNLDYINKADYYLSYAVDSFYSKFKIKRLTALIAYKKGDFKTFNSLVENLKRNANETQKANLEEDLKLEKKKIRIFLWNQIEDDYFSKLQFYKFQVNTVAAAIIGEKHREDKSSAIKILKTISFDTLFNKENNYNLLTSVRTRLAHYYFYLQKDYSSALNYQKKIWKKKIYDLNFIGAFLRSISKCKEFKFGVDCCEVIIERNNSALASRFQGNFLKEIGRYEEALISYNISFELASKVEEIDIRETERKIREKVHVLNNIALLSVKSIQDEDFFIEREKLKKLGLECIHKIHDLDPTFNFIKSEYVEKTTQKLKLLR